MQQMTPVLELHAFGTAMHCTIEAPWVFASINIPLEAVGQKKKNEQTT